MSVRKMMIELNQRPVSYYPIYRKLTGRLTAGVLLSQILFHWSYWAQHEGRDKFHLTDAQLMEETGLTPDEFKLAKRALKALGFLKITREGVPARTYYEVDAEALAQAIRDLESDTGKSRELDGGNPPSQMVEIPPTRLGVYQQTINTETPTETPSENNSPPYPPSSSTGPSGRLGEEAAAKDAGVRSTEPTALEASLGPTAQAIAAVAPGGLHRRVPGRDYTVLDRLRAWDEMWTPEEVRAAWAQAKRDAHTHPLKVFWLILEGEIPLDPSLVEPPPEPERPKKPDREYRYIGIDDVPDPLEVLYGKKSASA